MIYINHNSASVTGGGTSPSFTTEKAFLLTYVQHYHWNDAKGASPGKISLEGKDGTVYGPWQAKGVDGQGGVPNAYWVAEPNVTLPPGTYTAIDSDPTSWAQNAGNGGKGMVQLFGVPQ